MAIIKCKMCGGDLMLEPGGSIAVCEYCGSRQTVPSAGDERKLSLFDRAHKLRYDCRFDQAVPVYESIVADFPQEAEAYWGLVLCKYGIEYVDDPQSGKKIPTCHRSSFQSVMEDRDYQKAVLCADAVARGLYQAEGRAIENLRKNILEVSGREAPYDVFICYKETDNRGNRTADSVLAQDVYDGLTAKGYRVFFSRISLEDKLGREYEPYIFAALNSAKVMLVFGSSYGNFNAVWVKNEWSRFLQLMAQDRDRYLIPCYKDMDPYDMPQEFTKLQAQDMDKLGAMQDLLRGVEKLVPKKQEKPQEAAAAGGYRNIDANIANLLMQGNVDLSIAEWIPAEKIFTKVLTMDGQCAEAYLGRCLARNEAENLEELEVQLSYNPAAIRQTVVRPGDIDSREHMLLEQFRQGDEDADRDLVKQIRFPGKREYSGMAAGIRERRDQVMQLFGMGGDLAAAERYGDSRMKRQLADLRARVESDYGPALQKAQQLEKQEHDAIVKAAQRHFSAQEKILSQRRQERQARWELAVRRAALASPLISVGHSVAAVKSDGTLVTAGYHSSDTKQLSQWKDLVAAGTGRMLTLGLKADGSVMLLTDSLMNYGKVQQWKHIAAVAVGDTIAIGLKKDGTAVSTKLDANRRDVVSGWKGIKAVSAGEDFVVGLRGDGTVVTAGRPGAKTAAWRNIAAISAGTDHITGLKADGTVVTEGLKGIPEKIVAGWKDIVAVASGEWYTVGLKCDGTVVVSDDAYNVSAWKNVVAVAAGRWGIAGITADGRVLTDRGIAIPRLFGNIETFAQEQAAAFQARREQEAEARRLEEEEKEKQAQQQRREAQELKQQREEQQRREAEQRRKREEERRLLEAEKAQKLEQLRQQLPALIERSRNLKGIVAAGSNHTVALRENGTVLAAGYNRDGQCDVSGWKEIVAVDAGTDHTVGLKADGTVVATGLKREGQCRVSGWKGIVQVAAGNYYTVGLQADGTVVATGENDRGQCDVAGWKGIVAIAAGANHTVGLKANGSVVAVGAKDKGQCQVFDWKNIVAIAAGYQHTLGLRADGTVVSTGDNGFGQTRTDEWEFVHAISAKGNCSAALQCNDYALYSGMNSEGQGNVGAWRGIRSVAAGFSHTVGLQWDGRVRAVGRNDDGQCAVSQWKLCTGGQDLEHFLLTLNKRKEIGKLQAQLHGLGAFSPGRKELKERIALAQEELKKL